MNTPPTPPFVAQKNQDDENTIILPNMEFFPDIHLKDFQERYQVDNSHLPQRQVQNLKSAMYKVNKQLLENASQESGINWVCEQVRKGYFTLAEVPTIYAPEEKTEQYLTAIYSWAKSLLTKKYRDTQTTRSGHDRADDLELGTDDYEQESKEALRQLMDKPRMTIELV